MIINLKSSSLLHLCVGVCVCEQSFGIYKCISLDATLLVSLVPAVLVVVYVRHIDRIFRKFSQLLAGAYLNSQ